MSKDIDVIHVAGPRSKDVVDALEPAAADVGFLKSKTIDNFAGLGFSVNLFRVSFTGCVGYELHAGTMRAVQFHLNAGPIRLRLAPHTYAPAHGGASYVWCVKRNQEKRPPEKYYRPVS